MSRRANAAVVAFSIASSACARTAATPANVAPVLYEPPEARAVPTLDDVASARGFPGGTRVDVETLDHAPFVSALRKEEKATDWSAHFADLYFSALSMATPSEGAGAASQRSYDENVAGFYSPSSKKLYLRRDMVAQPKTSAMTIAHEEEHALQDRFFGIPEFRKMANADEMLAGKALIEGDATLTSMVVDFRRQGWTDTLSVAAVARLGEEPPAAPGHASGDGVPALARATTNWPYWRGSSFAAQLVESGGWRLLDAALRNPPQTTEQVLHIEKYVAGEGAIGVRTPETPDGYLGLEHGRMGELQTRYFLAECVDKRAAEEAAAGWGGDAFLIATQSSARALLWSTVWDDEAAAARFADALEARRQCKGGEKPPFVALHEGTKVAFVQGLDDDSVRTEEARKLLALVDHPHAPLPPLGEVTARFHPPAPIDFAHRSWTTGGRFLAPQLGLESASMGLSAKRDDNHEMLASSGALTVALAVRWSPPSDALRDSFLAALADAVRKGSPSGQVIDRGVSRIPMGTANVEARTLEGKRTVRLALIPVCQGRMSVVVIASWPTGSLDDAARGDAWLASVRASETSPACDALKTLRDPAAP